MTTHISSYLEFSRTSIRIAIVGLPTEVSGNIIDFLATNTNLVFLSAEGELTYVFLYRFPAFGSQPYTFHQTSGGHTTRSVLDQE